MQFMTDELLKNYHAQHRNYIYLASSVGKKLSFLKAIAAPKMLIFKLLIYIMH